MSIQAFEQDIKAAFPQMSHTEINRLKLDIESGRITFSKEPETGRIGLLFKAGSQVPPTVIRGSISVMHPPYESSKQVEEPPKESTQAVKLDEALYKPSSQLNSITLLDASTNSEEVDPVLSPFSTIKGRNWMAERVLDGSELQFPPTVLLLGNGPFEDMELGKFLFRYKIRAKLKNLHFNATCNEITEWQSLESLIKPIVVLGQNNFESKGLISLLLSEGLRDSSQNFPTSIKHWIKRINMGNGNCCYLRSKSLENIIFISQEMLLAGIFSKGDGALDFGSSWQNHIANHPGLKAVCGLREDIKRLNEAFQWPKTEAELGDQAIGPTDWPQVGMLKFLGYSVGVNGQTRTTRQRILSDLFYKVNLPKVENQDYVDEWGGEESGSRLKKMAQSIAAFCRAARRRGEDAMSVAIDEWEEDLAWLKTTYYVGKFDRQFTWPESQQ